MRRLTNIVVLLPILLLGCDETIVTDLDFALDAPVEGAFASTFPDAAWMREQRLGEQIYWQARDLEGWRIGYWFPASNWGYQSEIDSLLAITEAGLVQGLAITDQRETPFFWLLIPADWFAAFAGIDAARVDVDARDFGPYQIDAVSGATLSCEAVIQDVWDGLEAFQRVQ